MVSPLWWRFLQTLRQTFDYKHRWPYLGNAAKYFCAASVAVFGVFDPSLRSSPIWLTGFVVATLYQVFWDIFMDWELFQKGRLRHHRLFPASVYWMILVINVALRFCWTLTFLPPRYLNAAGRLTDLGTLTLFGPSIASAEIVRRTLWGWIRLEWEATKHMHHDDVHKIQDESVELTPMKVQATTEGGATTPALRLTSDMSSMNDVQILGELCLYATIFCVVGAVAAAHRGTL
jgi:hypothetical protein